MNRLRFEQDVSFLDSKNRQSVSQLLKNDFDARVARNAKYSLRSFARFLEVPVSTLSNLMTGIANPHATTIRSLAKKLGWNAETVREALEVSRARKADKQEKMNARNEVAPTRELVGTQVPLAVLAVARTLRHSADPAAIASYLGASAEEVAQTLDYLIKSKFVYIENEVLKVYHPGPAVIDDPNGPLMQIYLSEWLRRGATQVVSDRSHEANGITLPIVIPKERLDLLVSKFEAFARDVRKSFPIEEAEGELYCVGAVIYPYKLS